MKPQDESAEQPHGPIAQGDSEILSLLAKVDELNDEERIAAFSARLEHLRSHRNELLKKGIDPAQLDRYVTTCEAALEDFKQKAARCVEMQERLLHAAADVGDAMRDVVDKLEEAVNVAREERPFDPQVQEWMDVLEELREQYPKIES